MPRKKSLLSDATKYEFAKELGVANQIGNLNLPANTDPNSFKYEFSHELGVSPQSQGSLYFGNLSSKNCGNFVRLAIQKMEQNMV